MPPFVRIKKKRAPGPDEKVCPTCSGTGRVDNHVCTTCSGSGVVDKTQAEKDSGNGS